MPENIYKKGTLKKNPLKKPFTRGVECRLLKINFMAKVKTAPLYQLSTKDERANTPKKVKNSSRKNLIFNHTCLNRIADELDRRINI